jgi:hypothetical protein
LSRSIRKVTGPSSIGPPEPAQRTDYFVQRAVVWLESEQQAIERELPGHYLAAIYREHVERLDTPI